MMSLRTEADRLLALFAGTGAERIEADILQPAEVLLDLYGEDIRARAYVTSDPLRGEQMLRPDFTVPVVQAHMAARAEPARYTYAGPVFRRQESDEGRPSEYYQVGYEVFDRSAPDAVEADVFTLFYQMLAPLKLRAVTGDIGILVAAVQGLETTDARKAALMRHIWRPTRFLALLERFGYETRALPDGTSGPVIGLRRPSEVDARREALRLDAASAPISAQDIAHLVALLEVKGAAPDAAATLRAMVADMPAIGPAVDRLDARLAAFAVRGVPVETLEFEVSYGRTSMEYYDGFVFGFTAPGLPPVASGGRYDALTRVLGQGRDVPAVGGVIRPDLTLKLAEMRDA